MSETFAPMEPNDLVELLIDKYKRIAELEKALGDAIYAMECEYAPFETYIADAKKALEGGGDE